MQPARRTGRSTRNSRHWRRRAKRNSWTIRKKNRPRRSLLPRADTTGLSSDTVFDKGTESNDWRSKFPVTVAVAWNGFRGPLTALVNSQLSLLLGYNGFLQRQVVALSAAAEVADEELDCVSYKTYLEFLQKMRG